MNAGLGPDVRASPGQSKDREDSVQTDIRYRPTSCRIRRRIGRLERDEARRSQTEGAVTEGSGKVNDQS